MARLAAQAKLCYFPAPRSTLALVAGLLRFPSVAHLLDPCCGAGDALALLSPREGNLTYGIELDAGRAAQAAQKLTCVLHADALSSTIKAGSMGFCWLNPPFDDELKAAGLPAEPLEPQFLSLALSALHDSGILAFLLPSHRLRYDIIHTLTSYFTDVYQIILPPEGRPYGETLVMARKRPGGRNLQAATWKIDKKLTNELKPYQVPETEGPGSRFYRNAPTEQEILNALGDLLPSRPTGLLERPRPILPLSNGHLGMVLASGLLDGLITLANGKPVVIKGIARKQQYKVNEEITQADTKGGGSKQTHTITYSERSKLLIRTLDSHGILETYTDEGADDEPD